MKKMDNLFDQSSQEPTKALPKKKSRLRFSLRTLLIVAALSSSGFGLWWRWDPWIHIAQHTASGSIHRIQYVKKQNVFLIQTLGASLFERRDSSSANDKNATVIFDAKTGKQKFHVFWGDDPAVFGVVWSELSPKGRWVLYGYGGHGNYMRAFSYPDGKDLFSNGKHINNDYKVRIPSPFVDEEQFKIEGEDMINHVEISKNGQRMLVVDAFGRAQIRDANTGLPLLELKGERKKSPGSISGNGDRFALVEGPDVDTDSSLVLRDGSNGNKIANLLKPEEVQDLISVTFSPDGKRVLLRMLEHSLLFDARSGARIGRLKDTPLYRPFTPDSQRILTQWDSSNHVITKPFQPKKAKPNASVNTYLWSAETGKQLAVFKGGNQHYRPNASTDSFRLITGQMESNTFHVYIWDLQKKHLIKEMSWSCLKTGHIPSKARISESPDQKSMLISIDYTSWIGINQSLTKLEGKTEWIPHSTHVMVAPTNGAPYIWESNEQRKLFQFKIKGSEHTQPVFDVSNDGLTVAFAHGDKQISIYHNRRPEQWWGMVWLIEFWLTSAFALALVWSLWRDSSQLG